MDTPEEIAAAVDRDGCVIEWMSAATLECRSRLWLAGQLRGSAVAGCLCTVLDELGECLSERGCPSACWPHALLSIGDDTYAKLCPVLISDMTGAFAMRPEGGVA